jgi:TPR repeat protein
MSGSRTGLVLGGTVVLVLAVLVGVLTVAGKLPATVGWTAMVLAAAGVASMMLVTERRKPHAFTASRPETALLPLRRAGVVQVLPVHELDPVQLGVHPACTQPGAAAIPPYVPRAADTELDRALGRGGLVLVQGDSASGKSRTAYEALRRNAVRLGWTTVLVPRDAAALRELAAAPSGLANTVVWLDDLERYLCTDGVDDRLLATLCPRGRSGVALLATLRSQAREALGIDTDESSGKAGHVLARTKPVRLGRQLDETERAAAAGFRSDPRIAAALDAEDTVGLAEHLAAGRAIVARWQAGREGANEPGAALVSAAADLRRAGYVDPVPLDWLGALHTGYLSADFRARFGETDPAAALAWATTPVHGASAALRPEGQNRYLAFDYLVDHTEHRSDAPEVPEALWQWLLGARGLGVDQLFRIARVAAGAGRLTEAIRLWTPLAEANNQFAMFNLGWAAQASGDEAAAERWYAGAAEAGNSWAMSNLGTLAERRRDLRTAERWYRRAAEAGDTRGMTNLGGLLAQTGRIEEARAAYRRAAETGDPNGLRKEAVLELLHGDTRRGADLLRRVALAGDQTAVRLMGLLSPTEGTGAPRADVQALRRLAAEMGDAEAPLELARNLWNQGDLDGAESWFRRAAASGKSRVAEFGLAVLLEQRGRAAGAEPWYRRAAEHGLPEAMLNLGTMLQERGDYDEAESWYHRALDAGHLPAEVNLGALHWRRGNLAVGHNWYQRAAARGDELAKQALADFDAVHPGP